MGSDPNNNAQKEGRSGTGSVTNYDRPGSGNPENNGPEGICIRILPFGCAGGWRLRGEADGLGADQLEYVHGRVQAPGGIALAHRQPGHLTHQ